MEIALRPFKPENVKKILELHEKHAECFEDFEITEQFILDITQRRDFRIFVAELNEVVGFAGVLFQEGVGRAELGPIAIDPECKENGIGTKLVYRVFDFLREKKINRVIVKVKVDNKSGLEFFRNLEFVQEGYFKRYTHGGEDVLQLVRFL